ncbi:hypothetical protein K461DRAFT_249151 [Myriangium duriaei CBS 260.36]|uniref:Autophagy-related protein 14 n=1 Tax=Myriangium duriaei CBS 260.36 TaxID=1168546 RepID=A0A9P4J8E8_9PEZI|nr:hypothetical protein K461DRAFT_249151 [Myriangium duriaei CBS 260.36]
MASPAVAVRGPRWTTRERPWLVSWNRKLRHLNTIVIRNLTLSQPEGRLRARVTDDDALPNTLKSPAKLLALREAKTLGHSRSSDDLRPIQERLHINGAITHEQRNGSAKAPAKDRKVRPDGFKMRRRSTLDWASATPQSRQKRMEALSASRLADVFFSLHVQGVQEPVYVSETVTKTMNPTFQHISLDGCGPGIARLDVITVKIWVKSGTHDSFHVLLEMMLSLRSLQFIGKDLAGFNHPFPQNCILFQLTDGFYTCFTDAQVDESPNPFLEARSKLSSPRTLRTASFDALLRLSKLDDSIQDALALRDRLSSDLTSLADSSRQALLAKDRLNESRDYLKTINYAKSTVEKQLRSLRQTRDSKRASLIHRRDLLSRGRTEITTGTTDLHTAQTSLPQLRTDLTTLSKAITNQRRRISSDLSSIYPISPLPNAPLSFTIRSLPLPDSESLDSTDPSHLSAALGYVSHALLLLSFYLRHPLPYPPHPRSSTSLMTDPISSLKPHATPSGPVPYPPSSPAALSDPARTFPLYPRAPGPKYRFDYALFLLNKDLHVLLADAFGVRVLDIRQTLPNLMYVLACMAAGEGELPARKAGGVRGLIRGASGSVTAAGKEGRSGEREEGRLSAAATVVGDEWEDGGGGKGRDRGTVRWKRT